MNRRAACRRTAALRTACVVTAVLGIATPALARQNLCHETEVVTACWDRLKDEISKANVAAVAGQPANAKKKTETGIGDLTDSLGSSVKDFVPLLQLSGLLGPLQTDDKTGIVSVAF